MAISPAAITAGSPGGVSTSRPAWQPVIVATERCKGCALCIEACPPQVLALERTIVNAMGHRPVRLVDADACTSCARCARVCPDGVLTIYARPREP